MIAHLLLICDLGLILFVFFLSFFFHPQGFETFLSPEAILY